MMKKLKTENLGWLKTLASAIFVTPTMALVGYAKRKLSPPLKVKLTRQSLMISLPASQGGRLHILPRPGGSSGLTRTFEIVTAGDGKFALQASPDNLALATYESEPEAALALGAINTALTGSMLWKWAFRLVLVWLAWLFVTSYMEVSRQSPSAATPDVLGLAPTPGALPNIPSGPAAFQSIPTVTGPDGGDLSSYIFQQAKAAQQKAQKDALPPKAGVDNAAGLEGFGLKGATGSNGSGEGCDPKLAFKVPQQ